jgi:tetratricopeptide (TPR) repeat protein
MKCLAAIGVAVCLWSQEPSAQSPPPYFDEPKFIVSGVTDPAQRGGHGSDPVSRSADSLAKATAALRNSTSPADSAEKQGNALEAAREFQRAAELDPSEANLFNWGTELLTHRAADRAVEVFSKAHRLFPRSTRTLLGLAVSLYSRGSYDQAAQRFFEACDLDPANPEPYLFLGKVSSSAIADLDGFTKRMERFASLHPENAWANYYYASNLWKRKSADDAPVVVKVQTLLEKAVTLDPRLGAAFLQLGIVFADQNKLLKAIGAYQSAIRVNPEMEEAHYRLALAYRKTGQPEKAQKEVELYQQLSKQSAEALERERSEIQQFVFGLRDQSREKH